ncbi:MAG: arylsulfatase [Verrucomicrobia bacterium]|nr:arylsulfatase [Verrucomicrobiota bacterium]
MNLLRLSVSLSLLLSMFVFVGRAASPARPNLIIVLCDDMGYSDLGCYGGEIATPNLDSLAAGGVRFTQFYNTARCCPTRASLLTGLYPHQAGIGHMMGDNGTDAYRGDLNRHSVTIAEVLKPAGYRTYAVGKWHVTPGATATEIQRTHNWPLQRGFDRYYGIIHGASSYWDPSTPVRDNTLITSVNDPEYQPAEYYLTDAFTDHATRFIREHTRDQKEKPFFLYLAYTAAHWPMHARERDIAKYQGRYDAGYDAIRAARFAKEKKLGVIAPDATLSPGAEKWSDVKNKEFETRCMETYAAMISVMDEGIGRIVTELKQQGQFDNTLILFLQDNGGCAEVNGRVGEFKPRAAAPSLPPMAKDAQHYGSLPKQTRDGWPVRQGYGVMPGPADTYIAYGRGWANVSNTPFREYKHWVHEGGISTPLIAHWPAGIATARRGQLEPQPGHLIDLMATCVDLSGAKYPAQFAKEKIQPMEGVSLRSAFGGNSLNRTQPIFWEHEGNRAIRTGQWKLVSKHPGGWELYDIAADRSESTDLAAKHPARVKEMSAQYDAWATRVGARPWPLNQGAAKKKQKQSGEED